MSVSSSECGYAAEIKIAATIQAESSLAFNKLWIQYAKAEFYSHVTINTVETVKNNKIEGTQYSLSPAHYCSGRRRHPLCRVGNQEAKNSGQVFVQTVESHLTAIIRRS